MSFNSDFEIPAHLVSSYCKNPVDKIIEKISDPKCQAVIGTHPIITSKLFLKVIKEKKAGFVVSACVYNRQIINEFNEFRGICEKDLEGISGKGKEILDLKIDNFSGAIRFIYDKDIKIDPHVNTMYNKSRLNTRMTGLVDKHGEVYEWIVGGSLTLNGNNSIDYFVSVTDIDEINKCTHDWICLWLKAGILNIENSQELIRVVNSTCDETAFAQAWKKADVTGSKYMDEEVNSYFCAHDWCPSGTNNFLSAWKNRKNIIKISQDSNIPIGIKDEYLEKFQDKSRHTGFRLDFFSPSESKQKSLIMYKDGKIFLHVLLKNIFFTWLEKAPSKQGERYKDIGKSNPELNTAPELNNEANSELNTTLEMIKKIQEQQKQFEDTLDEILKRLDGTQDKPTGEEIFNNKFSTNGRGKDSSFLKDIL